MDANQITKLQDIEDYYHSNPTLPEYTFGVNKDTLEYIKQEVRMISNLPMIVTPNEDDLVLTFGGKQVTVYLAKPQEVNVKKMLLDSLDDLIVEIKLESNQLDTPELDVLIDQVKDWVLTNIK